MMDREAVERAFRAAFDAGREQGQDEATSFEWGSSSRYTADRAFADLFEDWNSDCKEIREVLAALGLPATNLATAAVAV